MSSWGWGVRSTLSKYGRIKEPVTRWKSEESERLRESEELRGGSSEGTEEDPDVEDPTSPRERSVEL